MKWISFNQTHPQRWAFKKDIPSHLQPLAVKVQFTFENAWIVRDENKRVLWPGGQWADTFDFILSSPGHVIGLRDRTSANAHVWSHEWRAAMDERIRERLAMA